MGIVFEKFLHSFCFVFSKINSVHVGNTLIIKLLLVGLNKSIYPIPFFAFTIIVWTWSIWIREQMSKFIVVKKLRRLNDEQFLREIFTGTSHVFPSFPFCSSNDVYKTWLLCNVVTIGSLFTRSVNWETSV
jgi:hypothetical protein